MQQQIKYFRRHLQLASVVPIILVAMLGGVFVIQMYYLSHAMRNVQQSYQMQTRARSLLKLMLDMETGLRGYLLTGDEHILQPYRDSAPQVDSALDELASLTSSDPQQTQSTQRIRTAYQLWHLYSTQMIERRQNSGPVTDLAVNLQGKQLMDEIRVARDELLQIEEHRLSDRINRVRRNMTSIFASAVLLSLFLGLLLATFSRRELAYVAGKYDNALNTSFSRSRELKESQKWLSAVLGSIGDGVLATDRDGRIMFSNEVAQQLLGREHADLTNRHTNEILYLIDEFDHEPVPDVFREVMYTEKRIASPGHIVLIRHDGSEIPVTAVASPIRDDGSISGVVIVLRDMTEQRKSER